MNLLDQRIRTFASQGLSPYEIEERLGMEHYTIQIVDEQRNRDGSRGVKEISPTARAVLNQRTYRRPGYDNIQETQTAD